MTNAMKKLLEFTTVLLKTYSDLKTSNALLAAFGQNLEDFESDEKSLERETEELDAKEAALPEGQKPKDVGVTKIKKFTSVLVDTTLDEIRRNKVERAGERHIRKNRGDTGGLVLQASNAILRTIITQLFAVGFALVEVVRERKPKRYTKSEEDRAIEQLDEIYNSVGIGPDDERRAEIYGLCSIKEGQRYSKSDEEKAQKRLDEILKSVNIGPDAPLRVEVIYLNSVEEGLLSKTHPTKTKPKGSVQVWTYVVSATLLITDEKVGEKIAMDFQSKVLAEGFWGTCHVYINPDGTATVNLTPPPPDMGNPKIFTDVDFDAESGEFTATKWANPEHPNYAQNADKLERDQRKDEHSAKNAVNDGLARVENIQSARRPRREHRLGADLQQKLQGSKPAS